MLLAYRACEREGYQHPSLCLIPKEVGNARSIVEINTLCTTSSAVFYVGPKESVLVESQENGKRKIIKPVPPAVIFLTPDNPNLPGIQAAMLIIDTVSEHEHKIFFRKDLQADWNPWDPLTMVR